MRKLVTLLVFGAAVAVVRAEEPPHFDFVRKLRANHYPDLALEYLQRIRKTAPADLQPRIELEIARTQLELARTETDAAKKPALLAEARKAFEGFVKNHPNSAETSEAKLELSGVAVQLGKAQLKRMQQQPPGPARLAEAARARAALEDAAKQMEAGVKELELRLVKYDDAKTDKELKEKRALEEARLRAELDRGILLLEEATTYLDDGKAETNTLHAETAKRARNVLEKVAAAAPDSSPIHWQARAWVGKCVHEEGDPTNARSRLEKLIKTAPSSTNQPGLEAGKRLASYFLIQIVLDAPQAKVDPYREQHDLAQAWIKNYPRELDTLEGQHVRFLLGEASVHLAQSLEAEKPPKRAEASVFYTQAERSFKELEQTPNDFTDRARLQRANVVFTRTGGEKTDIKNLPTFDACYIRALFEAAQMEHDAKTEKKPDELEKKRRQRNEHIVQALERGIRLAETQRPRPSKNDISTATSMLVYSYLLNGKDQEAIKLGEKLVRQDPLTPQASNVAMYTLQAYAQLLGQQGKLTDAEEEQFRKQMEALAKFIMERWPGESAADMAHFQMGMLLIRDKKYPEAVEELSAIRPTFGGVIHSQYFLAINAFQVADDKAVEKAKTRGADRERLAKEEQAYRARAVKALESLPELPPGSDPATSQIYVFAKVRLGQYLYTAKKYDAMQKLAEPLLKRLPDLHLPDEASREQAKTSLTLLTLYAAYGKAEDAFASGQGAKVHEALDKIVEQIKAGGLPELKKDAKLRGGILGLDLRASLQEGKLDHAKQVLKTMQATAENAQEASLGTLLPIVARVMKEQIQEVRKKNDKAALDKATTEFTALIDELAKGEKTPTPLFQRQVAQAYEDMEQHAKAIEIAGKITEPKEKDADQRLMQNYRASRILLIRAYRQNNQLSDAEKLLKEVYASWGKNNLDVQFERVHLLDANKKHGNAATEWNKLSKQLVSRIKDPDIKPRYFECYFYLIRSLYLHGVDASEAKYTKQAANMIVKLENAWPDFGGDESKARFDELLSQNKDLKEQYDALKGAK
jgi:hypothetical protein